MTLDDRRIPELSRRDPAIDTPQEQRPCNSSAPAWDRNRIKAMFWSTGIFVIANVMLHLTGRWHSLASLFRYIELSLTWLPIISAWVVANMVSRREHVLSTCFLSLIVNFASGYLLFAFGEGFLGIAMAFPILATMTWFGAVVGRASRFPPGANNGAL